MRGSNGRGAPAAARRRPEPGDDPRGQRPRDPFRHPRDPGRQRRRDGPQVPQRDGEPSSGRSRAREAPRVVRGRGESLVPLTDPGSGGRGRGRVGEERDELAHVLKRLVVAWLNAQECAPCPVAPSPSPSPSSDPGQRRDRPPGRVPRQRVGAGGGLFDHNVLDVAARRVKHEREQLDGLLGDHGGILSPTIVGRFRRRRRKRRRSSGGGGGERRRVQTSRGVNEPVSPVVGEPARQLAQPRYVEPRAPLGPEQHLPERRARAGVVVGEQPAGEVGKYLGDDGVGGIGLVVCFKKESRNEDREREREGEGEENERKASVLEKKKCASNHRLLLSP